MGLAYGGRIVAGGRSETYPLRLPLSLPARVSFVKMGLRLRLGVARLHACQKPVSGEPPAERRIRQLSFKNDRTLADYVGRLDPEVALMLRTITERTSAPPEAMAAGYGLTSFAQVWSKHSFGRNLVGGSARLPQAIGTVLGNRALLSAPVVSVEQSANGVQVNYRQNGQEQHLTARYAIVATQAHIARGVIADIPREIDDALGAIRYGPFLSAAILTDEQGPMPWDRNYAIATPGLAFGVFFNQASTLRIGQRQPGGSLMLFRGAEGAARLMDLGDREIEAQFLTDLMRLYPESRGVVREIVVQRWLYGAPYSFPGRAAFQPALTQPIGRIHLAGDYLEFPCMDAAIATATEAAGRIAEELKADSDDAAPGRRPKHVP
jgi:oxygen-dependent protoporphyrinogen oxidase